MTNCLVALFKSPAAPTLLLVVLEVLETVVVAADELAPLLAPDVVELEFRCPVSLAAFNAFLAAVLQSL